MDGGELLVPFTVSMTIFALANVLVGFPTSPAARRTTPGSSRSSSPVQLLLLAPGSDGCPGSHMTNIGVGLAPRGARAPREAEPARPAGRLETPLARDRASTSHRGRDTAGPSVSTVFVSALMWPLTSRLGSAFIGGEHADPLATIAGMWRDKGNAYHIFGTTTRTPRTPHRLGRAQRREPPGAARLLPGSPRREGRGRNCCIQPRRHFWICALRHGDVPPRALPRLQQARRWAGLAYILFPWHLERAVHASLVHIEILALLALAHSRSRASCVASVHPGRTGDTCSVAHHRIPRRNGCGLEQSRLVLSATTVLSGWRTYATCARTTACALAASVLVATLSIASGFGREVQSLGRQPRDIRASVDRTGGPVGRQRRRRRRLGFFHDSQMHGSFPEETSNYLGLLTIAMAASWPVLAWSYERP